MKSYYVRLENPKDGLDRNHEVHEARMPDLLAE